jgi:hypothetical protein
LGVAEVGSGACGYGLDLPSVLEIIFCAIVVGFQIR